MKGMKIIHLKTSVLFKDYDSLSSNWTSWGPHRSYNACVHESTNAREVDSIEEYPLCSCFPSPNCELVFRSYGFLCMMSANTVVESAIPLYVSHPLLFMPTNIWPWFIAYELVYISHRKCTLGIDVLLYAAWLPFLQYLFLRWFSSR